MYNHFNTVFLNELSKYNHFNAVSLYTLSKYNHFNAVSLYELSKCVQPLKCSVLIWTV